jgi:hypothetical protein
MMEISTYDDLGRITSQMNLYDGADVDFYAQGQNYIYGNFDATVYYIENGLLVKFPIQPNNTVWDWNTKQWVLYAPLAEEEVSVKRKKLLESSDWTQLPNGPLTTEQQQAWAVYRQELRDVTSQSGYPFNVIWPTPPQG